ncbi:hypothetical protein O181_089303 [Austropuccinia psidii MF-1]|uniref:Uncharacterized protein n=1 Tax=Austropuccinia psidii MF-1 TaxID=1389203 RepID=A0A9Q3P4G4_9BASI|nr:hypothetical protein [Austropuccinia psidii MF-1]
MNEGKDAEEITQKEVSPIARYTIFQTLPYWTNAQMMTIDFMHTVLLGMLRDFRITYLEILEENKFIQKKRKTLNEEGTTQNRSFEGSSQNSLKRRERDELSESGGSHLKRKKLVTIPETNLLINMGPPTTLDMGSDWKAQKSIFPSSPTISVREKKPTGSTSKNLYLLLQAQRNNKALKIHESR